jgi:hypothetical protein
MKIKNVLNESNIHHLYEAKKIVDNADKVADNIFDTIKKMCVAKKYETNMYTKCLDGRHIPVQNWHINFLQDVSILYVRKEKDIEVECMIYNSINSAQHEVLENSNLLFLEFKRGYESRDLLRVSFDANPKYYNEKNIRGNIMHEIVHHFQAAHIPDYAKYNEQYTNVIDGYFKEEDDDNRRFSILCYYFTRSEISANVNKLYYELEKGNVNGTNVNELYGKTFFYREYSDMLEEYNSLLSLPDEKWEVFRKMAQQHKFYKPTLELNNTKNCMVFKNSWHNFMDAMIKYMDNSVKIVIQKAIEDNKKNQG